MPAPFLITFRIHERETREGGEDGETHKEGGMEKHTTFGTDGRTEVHI